MGRARVILNNNIGFDDTEFDELVRLALSYRVKIKLKEILDMSIGIDDKLCLIDDLLLQGRMLSNEYCKRCLKKDPKKYQKLLEQSYKTIFNNKFWAQHQRGLCCEKCGSTEQLEWAHRNPRNKRRNVIKYYHSKDRTELKKEMKVSTLLCHHCHVDYDLYFKRNDEEFKEFMGTPKLVR